MKKTICCVAGKSGGHIIPGLSYLEKILAQDPDQDVLFFSSNSLLDKNILKNNPLVTHHVPLALENIPYKKFYKIPFFLVQLSFSFFKSLFWLIKTQPHIIISMGGYISLPVCIAAKLLAIRIELFELNVVPGKATSFLAPYVSTVRICFPETKKLLANAPCLLAEYPLKKEVLLQKNNRDSLLKKLKFHKTRKTILLLGGSQGSQFLNTLVTQIITSEILKHSVQIIHQTGLNEPDLFKAVYTKYGIPHRVFSFHHAIEKFYSMADLVICRAGAGTLFETAYFKTKCICIPLEATTTNHQVDNALSFSKNYPNQFITLAQKEVQDNPLILKNTITKLLKKA